EQAIDGYGERNPHGPTPLQASARARYRAKLHDARHGVASSRTPPHRQKKRPAPCAKSRFDRRSESQEIVSNTLVCPLKYIKMRIARETARGETCRTSSRITEFRPPSKGQAVWAWKASKQPWKPTLGKAAAASWRATPKLRAASGRTGPNWPAL